MYAQDEEIDVGSQRKIARVRRLMESPVIDARAKKMSDREVRAMLSEAHVTSQRFDMQEFLEGCRQRLDAKDDGVESCRCVCVCR